LRTAALFSLATQGGESLFPVSVESLRFARSQVSQQRRDLGHRICPVARSVKIPTLAAKNAAGMGHPAGWRGTRPWFTAQIYGSFVGGLRSAQTALPQDDNKKRLP